MNFWADLLAWVMSHPSTWYGVALFTLCLLSVVSKDHSLQKVSLTLIASWSAGCLLYSTLHPTKLLAANSLLDLATMVILVAILSGRNNAIRRYVSAFTFVSMLACHVAWMTFHPVTYYVYYLSLNMLLALLIGFMGGNCVLCIFQRARFHSVNSFPSVRRNSSIGGV